MNFNYVSFESILIILHEINMIIVTHPTTFVHCFGVLFSGTHCKGVSKQLRLSSLFLAQTRIRYHLGCLNSFQYPQSNRDSKRVSKRFSRVVAFIIDLSVSRVRGMPGMLSLRSCIAQFHPKHNAFKLVSKQLSVYLLYRSVFLAQTRFRSPFFPRLRNAFLTP